MLRVWKSLVAAGLLCVSAASTALELGGELPALDVPSRGELEINGDSVRFVPWSTEQITADTPALIFHMAARMSSDSIIAPLRDRLDKGDYAPGSFQSISVVNLDDALWGTQGLVTSELAKNKRAHPQAVLVADDEGRGLKAWSLEPKGVAVILLNTDGNIRLLKEGKLSEEDVNDIISALDDEIAKSEQLAKN
ncbi:YtfJ family protein [Spongiibacter tropicus]|uniref:YtfJ family protein n=1 Tax=Spongiibacter tropicus TaxID=454602 RepID=UPI003A98FF83